MADKYIFVDTMFLIWAIQKKATLGQENMIKWADAFVRQSSKQGLLLATCSVCVTEFFRGIPNNGDRRKFKDDIERNFLVVAFDADASSCATDLWHEMGKRTKALYTEGKRTTLPSDIYIAGAALHFKPEKVLTHDDKLKKWLSSKIKVIELTAPPLEQSDLALPSAGSVAQVREA